MSDHPVSSLDMLFQIAEENDLRLQVNFSLHSGFSIHLDTPGKTYSATAETREDAAAEIYRDLLNDEFVLLPRPSAHYLEALHKIADYEGLTLSFDYERCTITLEAAEKTWVVPWMDDLQAGSKQLYENLAKDGFIDPRNFPVEI